MSWRSVLDSLQTCLGHGVLSSAHLTSSSLCALSDEEVRGVRGEGGVVEHGAQFPVVCTGGSGSLGGGAGGMVGG
jgi:hypothetical protein